MYPPQYSPYIKLKLTGYSFQKDI